MSDERIDALIRRLDVPSDPPPGYVNVSFRVLAGVAREELARERTLRGRLAGRWLRPVPWPWVDRGVAIVVVLALLALAIAWASLGALSKRSNPLGWHPGHVLFGRENPAAGSYDVLTVGVDGSGGQLLLAAPREVTRVSHDGRRIAAATVAQGHVFPTLLDVDGSNRTELHPDPTLNLGAVAWSHDRAWLAFEGWDDTNPDRAGIYLMRADGTGLHRLTGAGVPGDFSPDDRAIVLERPEGLFAVNVDGTGERQVGTLKPDQSAGYLADGRSLYTVADGSLWIVDIATGSAREIQVPGGAATFARLAPDESSFVITYDATAATTTGIWTLGLDGQGLAQLVDDPNLGEVWPDWLP
jgi:hypothetical protein